MSDLTLETWENKVMEQHSLTWKLFQACSSNWRSISLYFIAAKAWTCRFAICHLLHLLLVSYYHHNVIISYPYQIHIVHIWWSDICWFVGSDYVMRPRVRPRLWLRKPQYLRAKLYIINHSNCSKFFIILVYQKFYFACFITLHHSFDSLFYFGFQEKHRRASNIQLGVSSFLFTDFLGFPTHHSDASPRSPQTCPVQWHGPAELWKTSESERPWKAYGLTLWLPPPL